MLSRAIWWQGALLVGAGAVGLAQLAPAAYEQLTQEDGLVEWATFAAFLAASAVFVFAALERTDDAQSSRWPRFFLFGLAGFCFFVAGEEISWAQRLFAFQPPEIFLEHNYQQEANLHNLLKGLLDTRWIVLAVALLYGVVWPVAAKRLQGNLQALAPTVLLLPGFAAVVLLEAFYPFELSGEVAELLLGLCFLAEALRRESRAPVRSIPALQLACFAAAMVIVPLSDRIMYGDAEAATARTRSDLERLALVLEDGGVVRPKLFRKRRVHKRMFTAVRARYLRFGPDASSEWGYFLDAWNQPIWIETKRIDRDRARAVLYSFGPNRRRDGDDIEIELELSRSRRTASAGVN